MAATASLVNNICYPSVAAAVDAYFSAIPVKYTAGSTSYRLEHVQVSGVWNIKSTAIDNQGTETVNYTVAATVPTFPNCDHTEPFFDGMAMGWGVAGAMIAALAIISLKDALK